MPRYRVNYFTSDDEGEPGPAGCTFDADVFIIDNDAVLFLNTVDENTSELIGAVTSGVWRTVEKFADTAPASEVKATFDGITERLAPPPMVDTDSVRVTHLIDTPDDGDDQ